MRKNPYRIVLANLNEEYKDDSSHRRLYTSKQEAYEMLKRLSGEDFCFDADAWKTWLQENGKL